MSRRLTTIPNEDGQEVKIAYKILGKNQCVYVVCVPPGKGTASFYALPIAEKIAERERLTVLGLRFFELQIVAGYPQHTLLSDPNLYVFEEIIFRPKMNGDGLHVLRRVGVVCPWNVLSYFRDFIEGIPQQVIDRELGAVF